MTPSTVLVNTTSSNNVVEFKPTKTIAPVTISMRGDHISYFNESKDVDRKAPANEAADWYAQRRISSIEAFFKVIKMGCSWSNLIYKEKHRAQINVLEATTLTVEFDDVVEGVNDWKTVAPKSKAFAAVPSPSHYTGNKNHGAGGYRLVYRLNRKVNGGEYKALVAEVMRMLSFDAAAVDEACKDCARFWYGAKDADLLCQSQENWDNPLDVDQILSDRAQRLGIPLLTPELARYLSGFDDRVVKLSSQADFYLLYDVSLPKEWAKTSRHDALRGLQQALTAQGLNELAVEIRQSVRGDSEDLRESQRQVADSRGYVESRAASGDLFQLPAIDSEYASTVDFDQTDFDQADWDEGVKDLQERERHKAALKAACFDDESVHNRDFYFSGIWSRLENGKLWDTMRNRYLGLATAIDATILGLVPNTTIFKHPLKNKKAEVPVKFNIIAGDSSSGKSVVLQLLKDTLGAVAWVIDEDRKDIQEYIVDTLKSRQGKEEHADAPNINPNLINTPPKSQVANSTPEALERLIAANQHYAKLADCIGGGSLPAMAMCLTVAESKKFMNRWHLLDDRLSYSSHLNELWDGEGSSVDRATGEQHYSIHKGMCGLLGFIQPDYLFELYKMERPSKKNPYAVTNGLGARLNVVLIEQTGTQDECIELDDSDTSTMKAEDKALSELKHELTHGIKNLQDLLEKTPYVKWEREAGQLYLDEWLPWLKEMRSKHNGHLTNYWDKADANLVRTAGSKACQRWINQNNTANEPIYLDFNQPDTTTPLTVKVDDVKVAIAQCKIYAATRIYHEFLMNEADRKDEAKTIETKTLKQDSEVRVKRFSDPELTRLWIEEQRAKGNTSVTKLIKAAGNDKALKRLKENHGVDVKAAIKTVVDKI